MKYKFFIGALALIFTSYSNAGCVGPTVAGECASGTEVYGYGNDADNSSGYESNSGARYEYDLNDPGDSIDYSTDLDAQRRDQMSTDTRRNMDRSSGQYGGGIYED